jgi:hypothetical protein
MPTRDPLKDAVPAVPREAPGNIGAPAPLPGAPGSAPAAAGTDATGAIADDFERERAARAAGMEAQSASDAAGQERKAAELEAASARRELADQHVKAAAEIQARYDKADAAAAAQLAQTQQALKGFQFRDYWANKSSAQKVLSALGVALGGFGAGLTHTANYALQILDKDMDDDHAQQVANLKLLSDDVLRARTGIDDARTARARATADLTAADAQKDRLISAQLTEAAARSDDANYKNIVAGHVAKLNEEAAAKDREAHKILRGMNLEDQEKQARIDEIKARAEMERAHASGTGGFVPKHGRGSGHGGGGAGRGGAYDAFRTAVLGAKDPNNIPDLGKLATAAGLKPNQIQGEVTKIRTEGSREDYLTKRNDAADARKKLVDERMANLQGSLDVVDADGRALGKAYDAADAHKLRTQIGAYDQFKTRMTALRDYIVQHGDRAWSVDDMQKRDSLGSAAAAAGRVYNGLGGTDASQRLEAAINGSIGTPGHGWWTGANVDVLNHNLEEAERQNQTRINTRLRPGGAGTSTGKKEAESKEPRDDAKIARARAVANDQNASPKSRTGAKNYLSMFGESP